MRTTLLLMLLASLFAFYHRGEIGAYLNTAHESRWSISKAHKAGKTLKQETAAKIACAKQIIKKIDFSIPGSKDLPELDATLNTGSTVEDIHDVAKNVPTADPDHVGGEGNTLLIVCKGLEELTSGIEKDLKIMRKNKTKQSVKGATNDNK